MASSLYFIVVLCLTSGLWIGANASGSDYCYDPCKACPNGWTQFGDQCYQFHRAPLAWADAEGVCLGLGGNLASVPDTARHDFIKQMINRVTNKNERTWVGGHDTAKEGMWLWTDGTQFDFSDWGSNQPDNAGNNEHCIELNFSDSNNFNDLPCTVPRPFVCGKHMMSDPV